jgi:hypothetical protein
MALLEEILMPGISYSINAKGYIKGTRDQVTFNNSSGKKD